MKPQLCFFLKKPSLVNRLMVPAVIKPYYGRRIFDESGALSINAIFNI